MYLSEVKVATGTTWLLLSHMKMSDRCQEMHWFLWRAEFRRISSVISSISTDWADLWHMVNESESELNVCWNVSHVRSADAKDSYQAHLGYLTTLWYLVNGVFQKKLSQRVVSAEFKCRSVTQQGQKSASTCDLQGRMVLQTQTHVSKYTQMVLILLQASIHWSLFKIYGMGEGDLMKDHGFYCEWIVFRMWYVIKW